MSKPNLPPLPDLQYKMFYRSDVLAELTAYAEEAVRQALAEAAEICADEGREWDSDAVITEKNYAEHCAQRIRAIIPETRDG